ncbi:hypothetical protein BDW74DRAFT_100231 [Aspergillus multicolor]|uniref:uncharacterized protein n=1 Tax=Aspergillus multicolor TaxID=41759 RepID=UPI003CCDF416
MTTVTVIACNPTGNGDDATLNAIIDDTIAENTISGKRLEQILNVLQVGTIPLNTDKILYDSYGSSYIARNKVLLLMKPRGGRQTEQLYVYVAETENVQIAGRYDIILARSWRDKFAVDGQDGRRTYSAAPTELLKGNNRKERKEWEKKAAQKEKDNLAEAAKREAEWEKRMKEQQGKGKGPSSGK